MVGKCKLCHNVSELVDSHLIPKAIYKLLKSFSGEENRHIVTADSISNKAYTTDLQIKSNALCTDCEHRFNVGGENFVLRDILRSEQDFLLLNKLNTIQDYIEYKGSKWIKPSSISQLNPEKYLYFASSIFWRASEIKWNHLNLSSNFNLGKKYSEQFRRYLLGQSTFPANACLNVFVSDDEHYSKMVSFPVCSKNSGFHSYVFMLPGVKFTLLVGKMAINSKLIYLNGDIAFVKTNFSNFDLNPEYRIIHEDLIIKTKPSIRLNKLFDQYQRGNS